MFYQLDKQVNEELEGSQVEGVVALNCNYYVALVTLNEESPLGYELNRKYHSTPYKDLNSAMQAAKDFSYMYRA